MTGTAAPFRVVVVDDEPAARRGVVQQLEGDEELEIVAECATGEEMIAAVTRESPDLVFLDVRMPGLDGFAALAGVRSSAPPLVIFVTGYDRYAVRAFETHAIDYVLKPFTPERFRRACDHAKTQLRQRISADDPYRTRLVGLLEQLAAHTASPSGDAEDDVRFLVRKTQGRAVLVPAADVAWVEARKDYVCLHTDDGAHLLRDTMANVERQLSAAQFVRVHRSALVRISHIAEIRTSVEGRLEVHLRDGSRHAVSASGRRQLQDRLGVKV